jgi:hypothetical protein
MAAAIEVTAPPRLPLCLREPSIAARRREHKRSTEQISAACIAGMPRTPSPPENSPARRRRATAAASLAAAPRARRVPAGVRAPRRRYFRRGPTLFAVGGTDRLTREALCFWRFRRSSGALRTGGIAALDHLSAPSVVARPVPCARQLYPGTRRLDTPDGDLEGGRAATARRHASSCMLAVEPDRSDTTAELAPARASVPPMRGEHS